MSDERAARYHRRQLVLGAASVLAGVVYLVAVLASGVAHDLAGAVARAGGEWWAQVAAVGLALAAGEKLLVFPLAWARGYALPRRYGLSHQPPGSWLGDRLKAGALGALLTLAGVEVVYGLLRATRWWWILAAGVFFAGYVATFRRKTRAGK